MLQLSGYYQSVDQGAAAADIDGIPDESLFVSGDIIRVPAEVSNICGAVALSAATTVTTAQVQTPSLRTKANLDIEPFINAVVFGSPPAITYFPNNPQPLLANESMTFSTNTDHGSATAIYGLVWLCDGPFAPVNGDIFSVRATGAATLSAGAWVNTNLTFFQDLPSGNYDVVGMRARGTNLVAARMVFIGGRWRPGVPAVNVIGDESFDPLRGGRSGILGSFDSNQPPTMDCLGVTDSAQVFILDLIKTS